MSDSHKKRLQENRPFLVENMTPDDIFNVLLSNKVLTTSEVSKIRENTGREAINEDLLDTLVRKPDRAFGIFVDGLRKSLQDHLADLLQSSKRKIKRKAGEFDISLQWIDIFVLESHKIIKNLSVQWQLVCYLYTPVTYLPVTGKILGCHG